MVSSKRRPAGFAQLDVSWECMLALEINNAAPRPPVRNMIVMDMKENW